MRTADDSLHSSGRELTLVAAYDVMQRHKKIDGEGIQKALDFELLALSSGADPSWDRKQLVKHQKRRAGKIGGLVTLARYGKPYYRALARARWGNTPRGVLPAIREILKSPRLPNSDRNDDAHLHDSMPERREEIAA
jgi:hypothetical protein